MLPSDLLRVRFTKDRVFPLFLKDKDIASDIISIFKKNVGKKLKELKKEIEELEEVDYKLVRGLFTLLLRRCRLEENVKIDPRVLRRKLFERGFVTDERERRRIIKEIAEELRISKEDVEECFLADLEEEKIIKDFKEIDAEELIKMYNLSIVQTLLFKATKIEAHFSGNFQRIFRAIKRLGLMYMARKNDEFVVEIEGPASVLKLTEKYGTSIAKVFPEIVKAKRWWIKAYTFFRNRNKTYIFFIDSRKRNLFNVKEEEMSFDSNVEKDFYIRFKSMETGWKIIREPEPIILDRTHVFIPDFKFVKGDMEVYMEIVGFWTPEYLRKKIYKLQRLKDENFIIAVDEELSCSTENVKGNIILFRKRIPVRSVAKILKDYERRKSLSKISEVDFYKEKEEVISLKDISEKYGVCEDVVRDEIRKSSKYILVGSSAVRKDFLINLKKKLEKIINPECNLEIVREFLKKEGINSVSILEKLGFKILWKSLNEAVVVRKD